MRVSVRRLAELIGFAIVVVGLPFEAHVARAQYPPTPFPVLQVDSAVRARLAEEWESENRYQHERGYCVRYTTELQPASWLRRSYVYYTVVAIVRGVESGARQSGLGGIGCPIGDDITYLHVHPPFFCDEAEDGSTCSKWSPLSHQCFPSDLDVATLVKSQRPFDLIECGPLEVVPYFRVLYSKL